MSGALRLVLGRGLSAKWLDVEQMLGNREAVVSKCTGSPAAVLSHCRLVAPCVLVVSESFMEQVNSDEFCRAVDFGRSIQVLVEFEEEDALKTESYVRLGCAGLLSRKATAERALNAVLAIVSGELWLGRKTVSGIVQKILCEAMHHLTLRESQILSLLAQGLKNYEIADRLFISPQTVRWHLRSLYSKLGTHDRVWAATRTSSPAGRNMSLSCRFVSTGTE